MDIRRGNPSGLAADEVFVLKVSPHCDVGSGLPERMRFDAFVGFMPLMNGDANVYRDVCGALPAARAGPPRIGSPRCHRGRDVGPRRYRLKARHKPARRTDKKPVSCAPPLGDGQSPACSLSRCEPARSSRRRAWTADGFGSSFNKAKIDAGMSERDLHFNDLRGTAATKFCIAGFSMR
jgi:hypothetical protein